MWLGALLLPEFAHVLHYAVDLFVTELAVESRHLIFAFFGALEKLGVSHLLHFGRMEIACSEFLASRGVAIAGCTMTSLAFRLVNVGGALGFGGSCQRANQQNR